ncbi:lysozyme family protein [Sphingomonas baiyangensis]|uniref:Chitinase class I n=1 Tax=Sphingomonas baiyangensis TaxID=2572576 RepID=A0A4U1L186_9SPHN|nr:hypothetical protein [Sphingomonas baiyangensis]TKD50234.1 hypothetical protein FBR43_05285 [Sphingomonas baiyangensis]
MAAALRRLPEAATRFDAEPFYAAIRKSLFGGTISPSQFEGIEAKLKAFAGQPLAYVAYMLATSYWETARTMQPIAEFGKGKGRKYGVSGPHGGQVAYGRGDVQLTWPDNYARADKELGLNGKLIGNYDNALDPDISAAIMLRGMTEGWFTGKKLSDYLPAAGPATEGGFTPARRIINGTDKQHEIAGIALKWQTALQAGGWA